MRIFLHFIFAQVNEFIQKQVEASFKKLNLPEWQKPKMFIGDVSDFEQNLLELKFIHLVEK